MKKKATRRPRKLKTEIERAIDQLQEAWGEEVLSDAPQWGSALGVHLRLCELEHLEEAAGELL